MALVMYFTLRARMEMFIVHWSSLRISVACLKASGSASACEIFQRFPRREDVAHEQNKFLSTLLQLGNSSQWILMILSSAMFCAEYNGIKAKQSYMKANEKFFKCNSNINWNSVLIVKECITFSDDKRILRDEKVIRIFDRCDEIQKNEED